MGNFKNINFIAFINSIILIGIMLLAILLDKTSIIFLLSFIFLGSLSFVLLKRVKNSWSVLRKVKKLEDVDFPKYKDSSIVFIGVVVLLITYISLILECLNSGNITSPIMINNWVFNVLIIICCLVGFISSGSGIIVSPCFNKGTEIFLVSDNNVTNGDELFNRATGSFKDGIIIGYYIFYYKDISVSYINNLGNVIIEGNNGHPFKIEITARRSKKYFSKVLNIN